ncbi:hypothetical protein K435DRAFT_38988 [Dendrothele bispora CBS 962.96]|uniref:Uncharacterized protein n=1 Tax=Dendrothele bispora (strain CBS 962.96) TaxID=1314807 RepID=A0A4S8M897_DENBC|nr:hypothetical protein K435DRAFT_38988 [Dendrothele bispora CBS 962.96]
MDPPLNPPIRIQPLSSKPVSTKKAERRLDTFLKNFQERTTAAQGGNTAVTVQLQKLKDALQEELHKN